MILRQFFPYFGSKVALAKKYPAPKYKTIIEPFAGSAGYATHYSAHNIRLYDKNPIICGIWEFLIGASRGDILRLPLEQDKIEALPDAPRHFIGFWFQRGSTHPNRAPGSWARSGLYEHSFWSEKTRARIAAQVESINHWKIKHASFEDAPDIKATWYIDPPYEGTGRRYPCHDINYQALASFVLSRQGQVITCGGETCEWLPFQPFFQNKTIKYQQKIRSVVERIFCVENGQVHAPLERV